MPAIARKSVRRRPARRGCAPRRETAAETRRRREEEDRRDADDLAKALAEPGEIPFEEYLRKRDLSLRARYRIRPDAERALDRLQKADYLRVKKRIFGMADEPRPRGTVKLAGEGDRYRLRVGVYRILYEDVGVPNGI